MAQPQLSGPRILVAVTGASGAIYAERLIEVLRQRVPRIYLLLTATAKKVVAHELHEYDELAAVPGVPPKFSLVRAARGELAESDRSVIRLLGIDDLFAPVASGSSAPTAMVVLPCSMGSLARICHGVSSNLLERSADVCLKQKRPLLICPRETPLNSIHLRNMLTLSDMGAHIVPAMPAFYQNPKTLDDLVDFVVGRVLEALDVEHDLYPAWNARMR